MIIFLSETNNDVANIQFYFEVRQENTIDLYFHFLKKMKSQKKDVLLQKNKPMARTGRMESHCLLN